MGDEQERSSAAEETAGQADASAADSRAGTPDGPRAGQAEPAGPADARLSSGGSEAVGSWPDDPDPVAARGGTTPGGETAEAAGTPGASKADADTDAATDAQQEDAEPEAAPASHRTRRVASAAGRGAIALVSVVVLAATAVGWITLDRLSGDVSTSRVLADAGEQEGPPIDDGATDLLLVGNDSRTDAQGNPLPEAILKELRTESSNGYNTDSLILVRVPHSGATPSAISIPRDTYTAAPGGSQEKINAVYGLAKTTAFDELDDKGVPAAEAERQSSAAGERALVQTVQNLTGARIDHYAEVNMLGFFEVTQALGGVEVCLNQATSDKDSGAEFAAGVQTISGGDALAFVRQRHGLPRGDLDRIVRQQAFMASVLNKVLSTGTLTDPAKVNGLVNAARRSVVLDQDWDVVGFAQQMQALAGGSVEFVTMPVVDAGARDDRNQSIVRVNPVQVKNFVAGLVTGPASPAPNPGSPTAVPPPGTAVPTPTGFGPRPLLRLDGPAHRQQPITPSGIPCVN
ncbi:LytR family transcriptional attenuator [Saccharopolyspora erythraea NRRL 2338]|uniref:Possible transcriptional regulator, LytR family n=2 Tax=Saccharopolyspora erythraea TaxID=1836 RepID=A4FNM6_SACEN|nr:LCP family protein [Saccharopolyspora erythraea]EQD84053.1 LytR family transcriptional regulator [Saccharopolyspora erythraea D]PFG99289.1 LytR family transcriptional attenuator [Saccharopolyspora erythraea NRRL 2338]QRK89225.1 LCP family protein [Saccharopolyspora erythraea]CAM05651.1 possible transcriptional regulator, LytR family [Saccharopolyspora erythraea NRRL 2338]